VDLNFNTYLVVKVSLEGSSYNVSEGQDLVQVCVVLSGPIERPVTVILESSPGSANNHSDFTPIEQTFTFRSNVRTCEDVMIVNDDVVEDTETFQVDVSSSDTDVILGQFPSAVVTINDYDGMYNIIARVR
jgi:hypothetical protein